MITSLTDGPDNKSKTFSSCILSFLLIFSVKTRRQNLNFEKFPLINEVLLYNLIWFLYKIGPRYL